MKETYTVPDVDLTNLTLDESSMQDAVFANLLEKDPNLKHLEGPAKAWAWALEIGGDEEFVNDCVASYIVGMKVLEHYTMWYTKRYRVLPPAIPHDVDGHIRVSAGHIATSPAYRLVYFRRRKEHPRHYVVTFKPGTEGGLVGIDLGETGRAEPAGYDKRGREVYDVYSETDISAQLDQSSAVQEYKELVE